MKTYSTIAEFLDAKKGMKGSVGFVPTMGALHAGHASLLARARSENDEVVLSVFINPTQFNQTTDFGTYPRTLDEDLALAKMHGVDHVLLPTEKEVYPDDFRYQIQEKELSRKFCGAFRPGHFEGVLTVVMKLFQIVSPTRAYFGEKDFQQLELVRGMVEAFFLPVEIVGCPTVRESEGLALSSRNRRLSQEQRIKAPRLNSILRKSVDAKTARMALEMEGFRVDYVEDHNGRRLAAVFLGEVRLIDEVKL